jgi:hypothetical protein
MAKTFIQVFFLLSLDFCIVSFFPDFIDFFLFFSLVFNGSFLIHKKESIYAYQLGSFNPRIYNSISKITLITNGYFKNQCINCCRGYFKWIYMYIQRKGASMPYIANERQKCDLNFHEKHWYIYIKPSHSYIWKSVSTERLTCTSKIALCSSAFLPSWFAMIA